MRRLNGWGWGARRRGIQSLTGLMHCAALQLDPGPSAPNMQPVPSLRVPRHAITTCTTAACPCAVLCSLANRRTRCDAHGLSAFPPKIRKTIGSKAQAPLAKKGPRQSTPYTHQTARAAAPRPPHCTRPRRLHSSPRASQVCSQALASAAALQPCSESSRRAPKLSHGGPERQSVLRRHPGLPSRMGGDVCPSHRWWSKAARNATLRRALRARFKSTSTAFSQESNS